MERNVKYTSIGIVLFLMVAGLVVFVLWLGRADFGRSRSYYILTTDDVSSLGVNTPIKFKGISVGKVVRVSFEDFENGVVRVSLSLDPALKVAEDAYMSVGSGGLAGASYLNFNQGKLDSENTSGIIGLRKGGLDALLDNVGELGQKASGIVDNISAMTGEPNVQNLQTILAQLSLISTNMSAMTQRLDSIAQSLDENLKGGQYDLRAILNPTMMQAQSTMLEMNEFFSKASYLIDKIEKSPYDSIFGKTKKQKE